MAGLLNGHGSYNLCTIQFTHLKFGFECIQSYATSPLCDFWNPFPVSNHCPFLPPSKPWQPSVHFLSLWLCLFWPHYTRGTHNMGSLVMGFLSLSTVFSSFIHVMARSHTSIFFISEKYSIVWIRHILVIHSSHDGHFGCSPWQCF